MRPDKLGRILALAGGAALFAWFIFVIRGGLASWFDVDDLMNMHIYWIHSWPQLLKANLMFWSSFYRPGGGLFYRSLYDWRGFHPLPFHIGALIVLAVDFLLLAIVVWLLTRSRFATLLALMLLGINPTFSGAYFDTGNIYDILAYAFFWGAFALYVRYREAGRQLGWGGFAIVFVLFVLALDAKEISVSLPVAVGLYELVWHPPQRWNVAGLWGWTRREGRFAALGGLAGLAYIAGKRYGPDSLWNIGPYQPHYSWANYFQSLAGYMRQLIYRPVHISAWKAGWLLLLMLVVAALTRRRCLLWATGFIAIGMLPLAFIPLRSGTGYMVPSVGWAVYAGGLADWLLDAVTFRRVWALGVSQVVLLLFLAAKLMPWQRKWIEMHAKAAHDMQLEHHRYIDQIHALIPKPRPGARILLLSDAGGHDDWDVYFVMRLFYGDPKLEVERDVVWKQRHVHVDPRSYDYVLDWVDQRFVLVSHK